jgi:hypothetical protein
MFLISLKAFKYPQLVGLTQSEWSAESWSLYFSPNSNGGAGISAKTKFSSLNLLSLFYPQTLKNEIDVSLTYGIAIMILNIQGVVAMVS